MHYLKYWRSRELLVNSERRPGRTSCKCLDGTMPTTCSRCASSKRSDDVLFVMASSSASQRYS
jgi:hypothetical protein